MSGFKSRLEQQMAIALKYNPDKDNAPVVVAAGSGFLAQKIIEIANKNNVPVYQDNSAASMLSAFDVGMEVPPELYQVIADIYVYILKAGYELHMS
ncbi:MAG: EscU/YscU/HrcU family type III secretion system export apparatus switch protein [Gracilibacteraceae bacterium]|jgi:flagellar biosynthesis protein|nr:EscU/YscU/HrcU family type III secretion system export apparatus switch protein [Gracilibacteraceae bacterium]MDR1322355.1 EscU/YscU/HrcU family type III secretion system export apparatus switch protein [Gracilibacteraceae bacterium]